jgi:hypothetical protein
LPFSVTSTQTQVCGLVHSKRLTVPVIVFSVSVLNAENEWCATSGTLPASSAETMAA